MKPAFDISDACIAACKVAGLHASRQLADHPQRVCLQISGVSGLFEYEDAVHLFKVGALECPLAAWWYRMSGAGVDLLLLRHDPCWNRET